MKKTISVTARGLAFSGFPQIVFTFFTCLALVTRLSGWSVENVFSQLATIFRFQSFSELLRKFISAKVRGI
jgi:hypothetical protein